MGSKSEISQCELRHRLHLQPRAVSIVPWRRSMQLDVVLQLDLRNSPQRLTQDLRFVLQLLLVWDVLIVASAAALEILAGRVNSLWRPLYQLRNCPPREAGLPGNDLHVRALA